MSIMVVIKITINLIIVFFLNTLANMMNDGSDTTAEDITNDNDVPSPAPESISVLAMGIIATSSA